MSNAAAETRELLEDFADEALDALRGLPDRLKEHLDEPTQDESINAVFRAVHSIKGNAGFFGLTAIKTFAHAVENTLDEIRKRKVTLTEDLLRALVESFDELDLMVNATLSGEIPDELAPHLRELLERIDRLSVKHAAELTLEQVLFEQVIELAADISQAGDDQVPEWAGRLQQLVDRYRAEKGEQQAAPASAGQTIPAEFVGVICRVGDKDVTQHVAGLIEPLLNIQRGEPCEPEARRFLDALRNFADWGQTAGENALAEVLHDAAADLQTILDSPVDIDASLVFIAWEKIGPELASLRVQSAEPAAPASDASEFQSPRSEGESARRPPVSPAAKSRQIRVKEERLDEFLEHVSSLFITGELLKDLHRRLGESEGASPLVDELKEVVRTLSAQSTQLQKSLVSLRRVAVSGLFSKFPPMARTLATQLGKQIAVHVAGEETEIDKSLVEDLDAPLTHMIRNVVDHGIEPPDERRARGAPEVGNLWLRAEETKTHIRIIVQDDGRGIDPDRLREKAVSKGVLTREQADALTDEQAIDLIFHAGFSTAEKLSEVSGRGVGLDVVRTKVREHDGDIHVESKVGCGTTFTLELPLRQAVLVIDGLMLRHAAQNFVLPFEHIREITELDPGQVSWVQGARVATIRGTSYHAVSLGEVLNLGPSEKGDGEKMSAILVGSKQGSICLLVDSVFGHRQVVVNNLNTTLPGMDNVAGVAQLGGGKLALVLSVPDLVASLNGVPVP